MAWPFTKPTTSVPDDVGEAQQMRREIEAQAEHVVNRAPTVARLTGYLAERRRLNHFGDSIQISFTRRTAND
jgi:hypothetical protein